MTVSLTRLAPLLALLACSGGRDPAERFVPPCPAGRTTCGAVCTNTRNDNRNCGACNTACGMNQRCANGACMPFTSPSCPSPGPGCDVTFVAGGYLAMGEEGSENATPAQTEVRVDDFVADVFEVTVARFRVWNNLGRPAVMPVTYPNGVRLMPPGAMGAQTPEPTPTSTLAQCNWSPTPQGREGHPLNCVDWGTALAFCMWEGGRLPTEAEWEYMARWRVVPDAPSPRRFPWGDQAPTLSGDCDRAHWRNCAGEAGAITRTVGLFPGSAFGIHDLAGNVGEWTADTAAPYTDRTCWGGMARTNPLCVGPSANRVARGVPFYTMPNGAAPNDLSLRGASRDLSLMAVGGTMVRGGGPRVGFRCVRNP